MKKIIQFYELLKESIFFKKIIVNLWGKLYLTTNPK